MTNVWVGTDLHLWNDEVDRHHRFRSDVNLGRLMDQYSKDIQAGDLFIYLGDLCDPGSADTEKLQKLLHAIPAHKVLCKGNHDTQDDVFYLDMGFDEVCDVAIVHSIVFSHKPVSIPMDMINVHGHLHTEKRSDMGYQYINAFDPDYRDHPILLDDLIDRAMLTKSVSATPTPPDEYQSLDRYTTYQKVLDLTDHVQLFPMDESSKNNTFLVQELETVQTPMELYQWMHRNIRYSNFTRLKSDVEIVKSRSGSCHDQVAFAYPRLRVLGVNPKVLFMIAYKEGEPTGGMTHSLIYWEEENGDVCWFENAWQGAQGIRKYKSLDDIKKDIVSRYKKMPSAQQFPELDFKTTSIKHFKPGIDLGTLVNTVFNPDGDGDLNETFSMFDPDFSNLNAQVITNTDLSDADLDYVHQTVTFFADIIQSPVWTFKVLTCPILELRSLPKDNLPFGGFDPDLEYVMVAQKEDLPEEISYIQAFTAVILRHMINLVNPTLDKVLADCIAMYVVVGLWGSMVSSEQYTYLGIDRYNDTYNFVDAIVTKKTYRILRDLVQGFASVDDLTLSEVCNTKEPMDEVLFGDIADTEFFLNDDDYDPAKRKKEPMADGLGDIQNESKIEYINDKGEKVPEICPKCGSKVCIFLRGEPVFLCSNKKCNKYFGTVPCNLDESVRELAKAGKAVNIYRIHTISADDELESAGAPFANTVDGAVQNYRRENWKTKEPPAEAYVHIPDPGYYDLRHSDEYWDSWWSTNNINLKLIGKIKINDDWSWEWIEQYNDNGTLVEAASEAKPDGYKSLNSFKHKVCDEGEFAHWKEQFPDELSRLDPDVNTTVTLWMTKDESKLVAYIALEQKGNQTIMKTLGIFPDYRSYGLDKQLMKYAKINGATLLYVNPSNKTAVELYKSCGWKFAEWKNRGMVQPMVLESKINESVSILDESSDKSTIDSNHKQNGHKSLSSFTCKTSRRNDEGKSVQLTWYDDDKVVATVLIDTIPASDGYRWFGSLKVTKSYRGFGLGDQIVKLAISAKYKAGALAVHKDNAVAISLYKKHGFTISTDRKSDEYYYMYYTPNQTPVMNEAIAETHPMDRDEENKVAAKYGIDPPGHYDYEKEEAKKNPAKERADKLREQRNQNLKKARKVKKRKAFVRKVKSKLHIKPKNEDTVVDDQGTNYTSEDLNIGPVSTRVRFFNQVNAYPNEVATELTLTDQNFSSMEELLAHFEKYHSHGPEPFIGESYQFELEDKNLRFLDSMTESTTSDEKLYPVYVMLIHSGTLLATAIKTMTNSKFSHSSISFDSSMRNMYSFGRKSDTNPFIGAFKKEDIQSDFYKKRQIPYALYVVPCTASELAMMKKRLNYFIANSTKFKYDFTGLMKNYFGIADNPEYKWFCSRFVSDILNAGAPAEHPYVMEPSLMKPEDFQNTNFAIYVTGGYISSYDQAYVDKTTNRILRLERIRRAKVKAVQAANPVEALPVAESAILDLDPFDPFQEAVLNYHLAMMDESVVDSFMDYLQSFKVRFDKEGNVIITRREYDQLDLHFRQSLKMMKAYEKAGNVEGVKEELYKIHYMIGLINQHYLSPKAKSTNRTKADLRKQMMDLRSVMLNAFQQHLKYVTVREPQYNFQRAYDSSKYGKETEVPKSVLTAIGKAVITKL